MERVGARRRREAASAGYASQRSLPDAIKRRIAWGRNHVPSLSALTHMKHGGSHRQAMLAPQPDECELFTPLPEAPMVPMVSQNAAAAGSGSEGKVYKNGFDCNICFDIASEPVVSQCGHLFCWLCMHEWISTPSQRENPVCPVCKCECDTSTLTPIYGRGDSTPRGSTRWNERRNSGTSTPAEEQVRACEAASSSGSDMTTTRMSAQPFSFLDVLLIPHIYPPSRLVDGASMGVLPPRPRPHIRPSRRPRRPLRSREWRPISPNRLIVMSGFLTGIFILQFVQGYIARRPAAAAAAAAAKVEMFERTGERRFGILVAVLLMTGLYLHRMRAHRHSDHVAALSRRQKVSVIVAGIVCLVILGIVAKF